MKNLKNKLNKKGGFTLIEMLIVVAIIAILIAVSIPLVNTALERTRQATDAANERCAKAEITIMYLTGGKISGSDFAVDTPYYYDADEGKLVDDIDSATPTYGKCNTNDHANLVLAVAIDEDGLVHLKWTSESLTIASSNYNTWDDSLCSAELIGK